MYDLHLKKPIEYHRSERQCSEEGIFLRPHTHSRNVPHFLLTEINVAVAPKRKLR